MGFLSGLAIGLVLGVIGIVLVIRNNKSKVTDNIGKL